MIAMGDGDAMVTGTTRSFAVAFDDISHVIDPKQGEKLIGVTIIIAQGRTVFISDTNVHEVPTPEELADFAIQTAAYARQFGHEPRVAFVSFSDFGQPMRPQMERVHQAVKVLDSRRVDFEYDGDMQADTALNFDHMKRLYPFCRLTGPANCLIMPALHSANISAKMLRVLGGGTVIGPLLAGLAKPVQVVQMGATVNDIVNAATLAAHDAIR